MSATASAAVGAKTLMSKRSTEASARLPRWANTLLVAGIGVALAMLTIKLLPQDERAPLPPVSAANSGSSRTTPTTLELARVIASVHLFGNAAEKVVEQPKEATKAPVVETKLNLQLSGVFAFTPADQAIAIISAGSAEQNAFGIGDKISNEVTLVEVHADHVVLRNRGKLEKLELPENVTPIAMRPVETAQTQASTSASAGQDLSQPLELPTNPGELRDTLARNPAMLGRIVSAEPYQENGKLVGYRITPKQNPEILEAQGIVAGDVITRVNNIQLNSQKQGIRALRNAVKAQNLEVTILRDGVEVPISISLAQ